MYGKEKKHKYTESNISWNVTIYPYVSSLSMVVLYITDSAEAVPIHYIDV